jgi:hypothetical protein
MTALSEHHWVVTVCVLPADDEERAEFELQIIVPGGDVMAAGRNALHLLEQLNVPEDRAKFTHITPHYFTDADSGGSR